MNHPRFQVHNSLYVVRAADEFGPAGKKIMGQVRRLKHRSRARVDDEIARAIQRKMKRVAGEIESD